MPRAYSCYRAHQTKPMQWLQKASKSTTKQAKLLVQQPPPAEHFWRADVIQKKMYIIIISLPSPPPARPPAYFKGGTGVRSAGVLVSSWLLPVD